MVDHYLGGAKAVPTCMLLALAYMFFLTLDKPEGKKTFAEDVNINIKQVKRSIQTIFSLTKDSKLPLGLKKVLVETFRCLICSTLPIKPPIIVAKCCKHILGCQACVDKWFSGSEGLQKCCPYCRTERGYTETMVLRGMDEFIGATKKLELVPDEPLAVTEPVVIP